MVNKMISRKKFIATTLTGIAGIKLFSKPLQRESFENIDLRTVGITGIRVTPLCYGAPRTNEESLIKYAVNKGINFIDTGRSYGNGNNERLVGKAVQGTRKDLVIQSKIRLEASEVPSGGKGRKGIEEIRRALNSKLEESLKALNTEYIDILLYHDALDENLLFHSETLKFFSDMKNAGTIRAHGFSTHNEYMNLMERNNNEKFYNVMMIPFNHKGSFVHSVSGRYSEWDKEKQLTILKEAYKMGVGIIAMKTCSGGKYSPSPGIEPSYKEAVRWVLEKDFISSAAIAFANFEQIDEQLVWLTGI
jgi:aryl-alcohol dehydrogenase-like predicted oxidoreductase